MAMVIYKQWPEIYKEIKWVDIDQHTELREQYGLTIPVLFKDQEIICESLVNIEAMINHFGQPAGTV